MYVQYDQVFFVRVVCYGIGVFNWFGYGGVILLQVKFVLVFVVFFVDVEIGVFELVCRGFDLDVVIGVEVYVFVFWQFQNQVFNKGCYVVVRFNGVFLFFNVKDFFGNFDFYVLFNCYLIGEMVVIGCFMFGDVIFFCWQNRFVV